MKVLSGCNQSPTAACDGFLEMDFESLTVLFGHCEKINMIFEVLQIVHCRETTFVVVNFVLIKKYIIYYFTIPSIRL